jgi:hypothetical protein
LILIHSHSSGLQAIIIVSLFYILSTSPLHTHLSYPGNGFITVSLITCEVSLAPSNPFLAIFQLPIPRLGPTTLDYCRTLNFVLSTSSLSLRLMLRPKVSRPVYLEIRQASGAYDQIFISHRQLQSCFCVAPSLTRGRVCLLYILLALVRILFLGAESLWTRDHILLSQIRDFPFRRLLRLAGSLVGNVRPRLHTNHFFFFVAFSLSLYNPSARTPRKTPCLLCHCLAMDILLLSRARLLRECLPGRCLTMGINVTICYTSIPSFQHRRGCP